MIGQLKGQVNATEFTSSIVIDVLFLTLTNSSCKLSTVKYFQFSFLFPLLNYNMYIKRQLTSDI